MAVPSGWKTPRTVGPLRRAGAGGVGRHQLAPPRLSRGAPGQQAHPHQDGCSRHQTLPHVDPRSASL